MTIFWVILGILIYTGLNIWWFLSMMGYKFRKGECTDWIFGFPTYVIACCFGLYYKIREKNNMLLNLFPFDPAKQAGRYAGTPKPTGCV